MGSSTRTLKVYNQEDEWVSIPQIRLGRGESSFYRININGISGNIQNDVEIAPKDSIFIFIETTIDYDQVSDPLYTDSIVFSSNTFNQDVKLVTLVKDAEFLFPQKGESLFIIKDDLWTNIRPYVIYGYGLVDSARTLDIQSGAKIHFHNNSGLIVYKDASLRVHGKLDDEVVFEGDRLEPAYSEIPGQWGIIWFYPTSKNNSIDYAVIKNGTIGVRVDSIGNSSKPTLEITNTQIYNQSYIGILAQNSYITGENLVVNNCGEVSLALQIGGKYNFKHSTFANFWNSSPRQTPSVYISNWYQSADGRIIARDLNEAFFGNCILTGNNEDELFLAFSEEAKFDYKFENSSIKYTNRKNDLGYEIEGNPLFENTLINVEHHFWDQYMNDLRITEESEVIGKGSIIYANEVPYDILNEKRNINGEVDLGAYQNITKEEDL
ncbi:MAG: hypothetical protein KAH10_03775 [Flavobacteriales bacterium]|nr:hypothetical protein [Flavobacteriales bacterium]